MTSPVVSIITATYNRSNILNYCIESVLNSTFREWEMIIVGDACTDNTEEIIASFNDPRIRFINLNENIGEQSGPNNRGFELSKGDYIAYLNHDDLYFPSHLESSLEMIDETGADLIYSAMLIARPKEKNTVDVEKCEFDFCPTATGVNYSMRVGIPASSWLLKRSLITRIGPWKSAYDCYGASSQEYLFRAWKSGARLMFKPNVTLLAIQSGSRKNSYKNRQYHEHQYYWEQMQNNPDFCANALNSIIVEFLNQPITFRRVLRRRLGSIFYKLCTTFKLYPKDIRSMLTMQKGEFIQELRKTRGLD